MRLIACVLAALVLALLATGAAAAPNSVSPRTVIVETDMAQDDAMAILFLLRHPDVRVAAIVVDGNGMVRCPPGAANALSLAALAGKPSIPVGCGRKRPLEGSHAFPTEWRRGAGDFWGLGRPAKPARAPAGTGQQVLRSAIGSAKGQVDVMTLGPPTELAVLLSSSSALKKKIRSVTMMGGAVGVPGNVRPVIDNAFAEWNFYIDPRATSVVFRSGLPITLVPLDATSHVPLNAGVARRLGRSRTAAFVRDLIGMFTSLPAQYFWDPLAAAIVVEPGIGSYANKRLSVVEAEGAESGRTVETVDGAPVRVTISANKARFERSFTSTLR
jgi:inosine-uridine nucleoside N-ribohydrolase